MEAQNLKIKTIIGFDEVRNDHEMIMISKLAELRDEQTRNLSRLNSSRRKRNEQNLA